MKVFSFAILMEGSRLSRMEAKWVDPTKQPPKPETMTTPGNFETFTDLMRKIVPAKPKDVSHGPVAS